jgi:hypothetical protein
MNGNGKDLNRRERRERKGRQRMFLLEKKGLGLSWRSLRPLRLAPLPLPFAD